MPVHRESGGFEKNSDVDLEVNSIVSQIHDELEGYVDSEAQLSKICSQRVVIID